jgi:hypothetical protein
MYISNPFFGSDSDSGETRSLFNDLGRNRITLATPAIEKYCRIEWLKGAKLKTIYRLMIRFAELGDVATFLASSASPVVQDF